MGISNITLVKIGAIGGVATVTMGLLLEGKIQNNIKATEYYKDALRTLRSHKGAVYLLGEPIKDKGIDIRNENKNYTKQNIASYEVPIVGSKQKGILYFSAERENCDSSWIVNRIELELANDSTRRLLIKSSNSK
ncbi:hypothetical protein NQ314_016173 [Rhamnusium bicolor]|uniref:Uncharacterized protein n=1 Tax=Rhamnusium bicolor TaxID=1586634 RepID=A0AAV8WWY1_9CUCU|nr:hypothetical protein NQ314_016173 [Rhamnusium bicolor]